ncbi:hypothetical protein [Singulisphaera sp. PoT]|uniref:hypothetical protein n=1 Tax=Singulisphaera sp. PoT TaxID=3411797 RepID=UPI003BF60678
MRRLFSSAFLFVALAFGQLAGAATITKPFNFTLGAAYSGLASTVSYKIVLVDGSTPIGPITATGITEGSFGAVTVTGSYNVNVANFDTTWVGKIVWVESTSGLVYEEPFTATQSTDVAANVTAIKAKTDNLPANPAAAGGTVTVAGYADGQDPATLLLSAQIENGISMLKSLQLVTAYAAGTIVESVDHTTTIFKAAGNPAVTRIQSTNTNTTRNTVLP